MRNIHMLQDDRAAADGARPSPGGSSATGDDLRVTRSTRCAQKLENAVDPYEARPHFVDEHASRALAGVTGH